MPDVHDANNDFNGDGFSDILWRQSSSGEIFSFLKIPPNSIFTNGAWSDNYIPSRAQVSLDWHLLGIGDLDGDHKDDLLWRRQDGLSQTWLANSSGGFTDNSAKFTVGISIAWHAQGVGDFNGDGRDDVLWRNDDGLLATWLGNASGGLSDNYLNSVVNVPTDWQVAGIGDFNGDGRADILWRNDKGQITDWLGQDDGSFAQNYFNSIMDVPLQWSIAAVGDFDGDGKSDILWRHPTGVICDFLAQANGGFVNNYSNSVTFPPPFSNGRYFDPLEWRVASIGDFNGDGRDDIMWANYDNYLPVSAGQTNGGLVFDQFAGLNHSALGWTYVVEGILLV